MYLTRWLILLLALVSSLAQASVGKITVQAADPGTITRSHERLSAVKGTGVDMNDLVATQAGKLGITFEDDTKVVVNDHSKLTIDDFVYDPKKGSGKLAMKFVSGTIEYASGQIAHNNPRHVNLNTPAATIAVRGTDFTSTIDELGETLVINLPSCPANFIDVERDCKTGAIEVVNDAGSVLLNKPFQGTMVVNRNSPPLKPTILHLTADVINNLLIVSPPPEIKRAENAQTKTQVDNSAQAVLAVNYLQQDFLQNAFDAQSTPYGSDPLTVPLLQQYFLADIFDILAQQLQDEQQQLLSNLLNPTNTLLPDYNPKTGVVATVTPGTVNLYRNDGSNTESVTVARVQNSTITMTQGAVTVKNRVNTGNNTLINVIQK